MSDAGKQVRQLYTAACREFATLLPPPYHCTRLSLDLFLERFNAFRISMHAATSWCRAVRDGRLGLHADFRREGRSKHRR